MLTIIDRHLVSGAEAAYANLYGLFRPSCQALWTDTLAGHDMPRETWRLTAFMVRCIIQESGLPKRGLLARLLELRPDGPYEHPLPATQEHFGHFLPRLLQPHTVEYGIGVAFCFDELQVGDYVEVWAERESP